MGDFDDDDLDAMLAAEEAMEQEQMAAMDAVRAFPPYFLFPPHFSTSSPPAQHTKPCPRNQPDVRRF